MGSVPKKLVVVGNGFDLAHGLETKLCCFKCYLKRKDDKSRKFLKSISEYIPLEQDWSNFEDALGNIDSDKIKSDAMDLSQSPNFDNFKDRSWGDPAYEAGKAVEFSSEIPLYLKEWIKSVRIEAKYKFSFPDDALFLSFNYTPTLEKIYGIPKEKVCYIHGDCSSADVLICGHNNASFLREDDYSDMDFAFQAQEVDDVLNGYYKETWKNPRRNIQKNQSFFNQLGSVESITVIGHSFETNIDDDYFICIKEKVNPDCAWEISFFSDSDKRNNEAFAKRLGLKNYSFFKIA